MNKKYLYIAGGVMACLLLLRACGSDDNAVASAQAPVVVQPPMRQPVIPQSQPQQPVILHDNDNSGFFSGLLMGHMLSGGRSYHSQTTVVHHYSALRYVMSKRNYSSRTVTTRRAKRSYYGRRR